MKIKHEKLVDFMIKVLNKVDIPLKDAKIMADILIESDLRGIDSHGINRFKPIYIDRINQGIVEPITKYEILKETKTTAVIDGHNGMGMVISYDAMQMALKKAKEYGISMVTVRNSSHYGIAGYYATMATKENMICLTGTNARPSIAPTFGVENMLGTNPLTVGFPTNDPFPFVLDCATSITQRGKIEYWARNDKDTPLGAVIDRDGNPLIDSKQILKDLVNKEAALTPLGGVGEELGGHKGYGYATIVEILSSSLQAGNFLRAISGLDQDGNKIPYNLGHFFIVIDPEAFLGIESFKETTTNILNDLRTSKLARGQSKIYTAGEKEYLVRLQREKEGIPIPEALEKEIKELGKTYNIDTEYLFN